MEEFDYIIVGAGSAGCVLAERLSRNPLKKVLVLEAGSRDISPMITMPKGVAKLLADPKHIWIYKVAQPREQGAEPREVWIRGKGLGGSSSVNGMIYMRGQAEDYDEWENRGASGWNWTSMMQAFQAIEDHEFGGDGVRGRGGPVRVESCKFRHPLAESLIAAGQEMGLHRLDDFNGAQQEGVGYYSFNIKNGRRQSAAEAFLRVAERRPNVKVITRALAKKILFSGRRAVGVATSVAGIGIDFRARGEVVICCGTIESPKLLQLSGIGPGDHLRSVGIEVLVDSPDVGRRMREHLSLALRYRMRGSGSLNREFYGTQLLKNALRYYLTRTGPLATGAMSVGAFVRSSPQVHRPDIQLYMDGVTFGIANGNSKVQVPLTRVERQPGLSIYAHLLRCTSEGTVMVTSTDPAVSPAISPNWLSTEADRQTAIHATHYMRRYVTQTAVAPKIDHEFFPGGSLQQSNDDIVSIWRKYATTGIHGVGTCRMGGDALAVVDHRLRVNGVEGLRIVDCSIMPGLISGNTNGPAMAMAWRSADLIIEDQRR